MTNEGGTHRDERPQLRDEDQGRADGDPIPGRRGGVRRFRRGVRVRRAGRSQAAGAHSHDGYEETVYGLEGTVTWTLEGRQVEVGPGEALCIPREEPSTASTTTTTSTRRCSRSSPPGSSAPTTSASSPPSSRPRPARPTSRRSASHAPPRPDAGGVTPQRRV